MREIKYSEAIREALREEMLRDENVYLLGEDIGIYGGAFGVTAGLFEEFGEDRIRDTPISEAAIVGTAIGSAMTGMRPVAEIMFEDFITIAMDQLVNQSAKLRYMTGGKLKVPMVVRLPGGCGTGAAAQHSQSLEAWFCHVPGLRVVMPSTPYDAKGLLKSSIRSNDPVVFIEHKLLYKTRGIVPEEEYTVPIGKAEIKRAGNDITIIASSLCVLKALQAAEILEKEGISVEIVDPRTISPLDFDTIEDSVKKTGKVLIVHEAVKDFGIGAEISARITEGVCFGYLDSPVKRLGGKPIPIPFNKNLEKACVPQVEDIVSSAKEVV